MTNILDWFEQPYAEDDALLNDWVERMLKHVAWKLFENQHQIVYMANETDNGIPLLKEDVIDVIASVINSEFGWLREYMITRILVSYAKGNIDLGEAGHWYINEQLDEDDAEQFWNEVDDFIWDDYCKVLGEARTAELWEKWGK